MSVTIAVKNFEIARRMKLVVEYIVELVIKVRINVYSVNGCINTTANHLPSFLDLEI